MIIFKPSFNPILIASICFSVKFIFLFIIFILFISTLFDILFIIYSFSLLIKELFKIIFKKFLRKEFISLNKDLILDKIDLKLFFLISFLLLYENLNLI